MLLSQPPPAAAAVLVNELHTGHCECPMNSLESRATIDPAFSQSLNPGIR
jgi:hypothetical protein